MRFCLMNFFLLRCNYIIYMKSFILILGMLIPAALSLAGETIPLDKDFSFRLEQSAPAQSSSKPFPAASPQTDSDGTAPVRTPQGEKLPSGSRSFEFNGQPYYIIPLNA